MFIARWRGNKSTPPSLDLPLVSAFNIYLLLSWSLIGACDSQENGLGGLFRSIFSLPDECSHEGIGASCSFILPCLYRGGSPINKCGGGYLYTCCIPNGAKKEDIVRSDTVRTLRLYPLKPLFRALGSRHSTGLSHHIPRPRFFPPPKSFLQMPPILPVRRLSRSQPKELVQHQQALTIQGPHYNQPECGLVQVPQISKRILGGEVARFAEFPWQAHIRIAGYQCGGVLLNNFFVATAAHCVHKASLSQITIILGEYDTKDTGLYEESFPKETVGVIERKIHPSFKYMLTQPDRFDVAVLRISRPVQYRPNILPICLPDADLDFTYTEGVISGWGKTEQSSGKTGTFILRKVIVPIINNSECLRWHHYKGIDVKLHYEMFCAGHAEGKMDACLGDSGGPLIVRHHGRWTLAGIISAGFGCAVDHQPGIYHKVSVTSGWIANSIIP